MKLAPQSPRFPFRRKDWGRVLSQVLCVLFALFGALPLSAGFVARTDFAREWASRETARALRETLGIEASYEVTLSLLPLKLALLNLRVESNDSLGPALTADSATITPRVFSLIAGRVDVGDIELAAPVHRLVVRDGKLTNLDFHVPPSSPGGGPTRAPFTSIAITDARFDLDIDGVRVKTGIVDVDVFSEPNQVFEVAVRANDGAVEYPRGFFSRGLRIPDPRANANVSNSVLAEWDSDVLCQLDARVRLSPDEVLVRRLALIGSADIDPHEGTAPSCLRASEEGEVPGRVAVRARQLRLVPPTETRKWFAQGDIMVRVPVDLGSRFSSMRYRGWVGVNGDVRYDGSTKLPSFVGKVRSGELMLDTVRLLENSEGRVEIANDRIRMPEAKARYAGGDVTLTDINFAPFEPGLPLRVGKVHGTNVSFPLMMRDIDVTPNTIVRWHFDKTIVTDFKGTLVPAKLDGDLYAETSQFQITNAAYHQKDRRHVFGVEPRAVITGRFGVRNDSVQFNETVLRFGASRMLATVHLGFSSWIRLSVPESSLDLQDISPIVTVPLQGKARLTAEMSGPMADPELVGSLSVEDLVFGGFPIGTIERSKLRFRPLAVDIEGGVIRKGGSRFDVPTARLDFGGDASVSADLQVSSQGADVRDILHMWHFDQDPTWNNVAGRMSARARIRYALGGPTDQCGGGDLRITGDSQLSALELFDERYDRGNADFDFHWRDIEAGYHGFRLNLPSFHLKKGEGSLFGSFEITEGAKVQATLAGTSVPISSLDSARALKSYVAGHLGMTGTLGGSLDELEAQVHANIGPVLIGRTKLPASELSIQLKPLPAAIEFKPERTGCGRPIPEKRDLKADRQVGTYYIGGQLFGRQIEFDEFSVSRQTNKVAAGNVRFTKLSLAPFLELRPDIALTKERPQGEFTGSISMSRLPLDDMTRAQATARIDELWLHWKGFRFQTLPVKNVEARAGKLSVPELTLRVATPGGHATSFVVTGSVNGIGAAPELDLELVLHPVDLQTWAEVLPRAERVKGTLQGRVHLSGPLTKLSQSGSVTLRDAQLALRGGEIALDDLNVDIALDDTKVSLNRATARLNGGSVSARGSAPISGLTLGSYRGQLQARDVRLPSTPGVQITVDADLETVWFPKTSSEQALLPKVAGEINIKSFEYTRPVTMNADIADLAKRGKRTQFESYDPAKDLVELDMNVVSQSPLKLSNNLIDTSLTVEKPGLRLTGTNQRFGLRGRVKVVPGGHIRLRRNEFEVQSGEIRFDDATQIVPRVDVRAVTEYRRYSSSSSAAAADPTATTSTSAASGDWRISMHAHGDSENLKLDLTSEPKLSQDDIFLLLTVGLTRAELDQAQSASLGESVALEALGSLTGADTAVTDAVPVIDEFRFGSAYSSRTGRTEPTVTIGKRLTRRLRAFVTSGLSESREVRSNVEWRLNRGVSVEGSYDNVNDISSAGLGNLGADVRWRLEFE